MSLGNFSDSSIHTNKSTQNFCRGSSSTFSVLKKIILLFNTSIQFNSCIFGNLAKINFSHAISILDINITYLATPNISPREIIKISPYAKINPCEIGKICNRKNKSTRKLISRNLIVLKSDSHLPKKFVLFTSLKSPLKVMKNTFYFILKAYFVFKIFKIFS